MPDATSGKINLLGLHMSKKAAMFGGIAVVGIGGIYYYRQKQNAASNATAVDNSGANTGLDPATGYAYGSPEDAAALANQGQYQQPFNGGNFGDGQVIGYDGNGNPIYGPGGGIGGTGNGPGSFTNNAMWAQYVESYLESTEGADPTTVGNAIGKYITAQPLTDSMVTVVQNAIAIGQYPPVAGPNGNPPGYITAHTTTPPPSTTKIKVPNVAGMDAAQAGQVLESVGLKPKITLTKTSDKPGIMHIITKTNPAAGAMVNPGSTITEFYRDSGKAIGWQDTTKKPVITHGR